MPRHRSTASVAGYELAALLAHRDDLVGRRLLRSPIPASGTATTLVYFADAGSAVASSLASTIGGDTASMVDSWLASPWHIDAGSPPDASFALALLGDSGSSAASSESAAVSSSAAIWKSARTGDLKPLPYTPIDHAGPLAAGLVALLPFWDGAGPTAYDASSFANHGTLGSGASWTAGPYGPAVKVNGTSTGYVYLGNNPSLQFGTGPFAFFARFRVDSAAGNNPIAWYGGTGTAAEWWIRLSSTTAISAVVLTTAVASSVAIPAVAAGSWHTAALARDAANLCTLYWDGKAIASATVAGSVSYTSGLYLGVRSDFVQTFAGAFDLAAAWNRGLAAAEVANLHANPHVIFRPRLLAFSTGPVVTSASSLDAATGFESSLIASVLADATTGADRHLSAALGGESAAGSESAIPSRLAGEPAGEGEASIVALANSEYAADLASGVESSILLALAGEAGDPPSVASWASAWLLGDSGLSSAAGLSWAILGDSGAVSSAALSTISVAASASSSDSGSGSESWWATSPVEYFRADPYAARLIVMASMSPDRFVVDPFAARVIQ